MTLARLAPSKMHSKMQSLHRDVLTEGCEGQQLVGLNRHVFTMFHWRRMNVEKRRRLECKFAPAELPSPMRAFPLPFSHLSGFVSVSLRVFLFSRLLKGGGVSASTRGPHHTQEQQQQHVCEACMYAQRRSFLYKVHRM